MNAKPESTKATVRFTLRFTREVEFTQHDKPSHYSNVEWAEQKLIDICQEAEFSVDGQNRETTYDFVKGSLPDEICED